MSDIPIKPAAEGAGGAPDPDAQELAAKHDIPLNEAERVIAERGNDRGEVDAEAQRQKLDGTIEPSTGD
ncbi:hypothetical protein [Aureimonas leprariae]|uniref:hypothetical protein n=1 Tax=Plantimonas leprariae TaxID=2615207 RepID=UPI0013871F3F|nr:hypothetical protein [Aureimonas leprariae]